MIHLALLVAALAAFAALCLADRRRQADLLGQTLPVAWGPRLRVIGWLSIVLGTIVATATLGGYGMVEWCGMLSVGAAASLLTLSWRCARR